MATIRKRGKTYLVQVSGGLGPNGKRVRLNRTVRGTKREAERVALELEAGVRGGTHVEPTRETVAEFIARWLPAQSVSESTLMRYASALRLHVTPHIGTKRLADVRTTDMLRLLSHWQAIGLAPGTRSLYYAVIRKAFGQAVAWGDLGRNPMTGLHAPTLMPPQNAVMDEDQLRRFLAALDDQQHRIPLLLLAFGGMRVGEALGLRWQDVQWTAGTLQIRQQWSSALHRFTDVKSHRSRRPVDMPAFIWPILREHQTEQLAAWVRAGDLWQSNDLVVSNELGYPIHDRAVRRAYHRLILRLGLPSNLRPHDLRHTMASLMLQDGVPVKVVQERLGHASAAFTLNRYGHVLPGMQQQAAERFASKLLPNQGRGNNAATNSVSGSDSTDENRPI